MDWYFYGLLRLECWLCYLRYKISIFSDCKPKNSIAISRISQSDRLSFLHFYGWIFEIINKLICICFDWNRYGFSKYLCFKLMTLINEVFDRPLEISQNLFEEWDLESRFMSGMDYLWLCIRFRKLLRLYLYSHWNCLFGWVSYP